MNIFWRCHSCRFIKPYTERLVKYDGSSLSMIIWDEGRIYFFLREPLDRQSFVAESEIFPNWEVTESTNEDAPNEDAQLFGDSPAGLQTQAASGMRSFTLRKPGPVLRLPRITLPFADSQIQHYSTCLRTLATASSTKTQLQQRRAGVSAMCSLCSSRLLAQRHSSTHSHSPACPPQQSIHNDLVTFYDTNHKETDLPSAHTLKQSPYSRKFASFVSSLFLHSFLTSIPAIESPNKLCIKEDSIETEQAQTITMSTPSKHQSFCNCSKCVTDMQISSFSMEPEVTDFHRQSPDDFDALHNMYLSELQPHPLTRSSAVRRANREAMAYTDDAEALTGPQTMSSTGRSFSIVPSDDGLVRQEDQDVTQSRPTTAPQVAMAYDESPPVHPADFYHTMRPLTSEQKDDLRGESIANSQRSSGHNIKRWVKKAEKVMEKLVAKDDIPNQSHRPFPSPKPLIIQHGDQQFTQLQRNVSLQTGKAHPDMHIISRQEALAKDQARKDAFERLNGKALTSNPNAPLAKRQVGHPDRGTVWEDFATYVSPESSKQSAADTAVLPPSPARIPAHFNNLTRKPVPLRIPSRQASKDSEFEVERRDSIDSQFSNMLPINVFKSMPPSPRQEMLRRQMRLQRKPVNEALHRVQTMEASKAFYRPERQVDAQSQHGSVHTGFTFPDTPSASPTSWPGSPAQFTIAPKKTRKAPPPPLKLKPGKDYFFTFPVTYRLQPAIDRALAENRLHRDVPPTEPMQPTPPHPSDSTSDEIEALRLRLDEPFDADDNSPIVDIREHAKHRSVKVQTRVNETTIESRYWRERRDEMDPAQKVWRDMEVEMRGGETSSAKSKDGRVPGKNGGFF
ncbi:unnamed protein product [Zymoseptoria tritici ST99CH_1A5]|uniref:Uncharacterized protein n=1 Tax=Zymoseptoria tritici ST99CH_1A5 TaxID=1276529 RepID=A0A1Y6LIY4_ZYMTR|nr:unnamed protein product [Zymoseptoria tritici ST99CH_1A5]